MQTLYIHISALIGLFAFLNQLVRYAPLDRTILVGVAAGVAVYVVLMFGEMIVKRIVESQGTSEEAAQPTRKNSTDDALKESAGTEPAAQAA
jgi:hypothetical protein